MELPAAIEGALEGVAAGECVREAVADLGPGISVTTVATGFGPGTGSKVEFKASCSGEGLLEQVGCLVDKDA